MYAVIRTGGKQYRVAPNQVVELEKLEGEAGTTVEFGEVLMVGGEAPVLGTPLIDGARVMARVLEQHRGPKIVIFKKRRRKNYRRRTGHRQWLTTVRITDIELASAGVADHAGATPFVDNGSAAASSASDISAVAPDATDTAMASTTDETAAT